MDARILGMTLAKAVKGSRCLPLEPYDGRGDVEEWMANYETREAAAGCDTASLAQDIRLHLKGRALDWYQARYDGGRGSAIGWDEFRSRFIKAFKSSTYELELRQELKRDQSGDDVLAFFDRRHKVCVRLNMTEEQTINSIRDSLSPYYHDRVFRKSFDSLDALRDYLQGLGDLRARRRERDRDSGSDAVVKRARNGPAGSSKPVPPGEHEQPYRQRRNGPASRYTECYRCHRVGHLAKDCRAPQQGGRNFGPPARVQSLSEFLSCYQSFGICDPETLLVSSRPAVGGYDGIQPARHRRAQRLQESSISCDELILAPNCLNQRGA